MTTRYSGYVTSAARDSKIAWGISQGSRKAMETKFHNENHVEPIHDAKELDASAYLHDVANVTKTDFVVRSRRSNAAVLMPMEKPFVATSMYLTEFPDYLQEIRTLQNLDIQAIENSFHNIDKQNQGFIIPTEVRMVLRDATHQEPTTHIVNVLQGFILRHNLTKITLSDFLNMLADLTEYLQRDLNSERPENMKAFREQTVKKLTNPYVVAQEEAATMRAIANAAPEVDTLYQTLSSSPSLDSTTSSSFGSTASSRRLLTAGPLGTENDTLKSTGLLVGLTREAQLNGEAVRRGLQPPIPKPGATTKTNLKLLGPNVLSTYDRDEGKYGEDPCKRPVRTVDIGGFYTTTSELAQGTTRMSKQIPGFMGFVPKFTQGAASQGLGKTARDTFLGHTNLTETYNTRVPNYGGYTPDFAINASNFINKPTGAQALTEYDQSTGAIDGFWSNRKR